MTLRPWLKFFRLPNLPTAPGDAWVGAAFALPFAEERLFQGVAAGVVALAIYLFGLADNDVVGANTDGAERPIPAGGISLRAAKIVRACLLLAVVGLGWAFALGRAWWGAAGSLVAVVWFYNRLKSKWLMGLCRGLSVAAGACAVHAECSGALAFLVLGWTAYIAAVTKLSEGEDRASAGLGRVRFIWGLAAFVPCGACFFLTPPQSPFLPLVGALFAYLNWCVAVSPLARPHDAGTRRRAVGLTIGALLYLQIGFMLVVPRMEFVAAVLAVWVASRLCRRLAPSISGS